MPMTSYKSVLAAIAAVVLVTACAKKEEEPAPEVNLEVTTEAPPATMEVTPADPAADANSADAEQSGGDKVSEPEPPPATE
jgi:hypothetical protein